MRLPEFARTTTFRWTLAVSGAFTLCTLLMFVFVLAEEYSYLSSDVDRLNSENARLVAAENKESRVRRLNEYLENDPRRVKLGALFDSDGNRIAGNIENLPTTLLTDSLPTDVSLIRVDALGSERQLARTVARRLDDNSILVVGRNVQQFHGSSELSGAH